MGMNYIHSKSVADALSILKSCNGNGRIIAGGTDLVIELDEGKKHADTLVDITRLSELSTISRINNTISIGAAVTHTSIVHSQLIKELAPALVEGCSHVGSLQIRNIATIGGNIVSAQPAADAAVPLAVMDAVCHINSIEGEKDVPLLSMYAGFGKSTLDSTREVLERITIRCEEPNEGSAYVRLALRNSLALPVLCVAARLRINAENLVEDVRIAMAPVGVGPVIALKAQEWLLGKEATEENFCKAGTLALENANPRDSAVRGSKSYRLATLPVLVRRALTKAASRATSITGEEDAT